MVDKYKFENGKFVLHSQSSVYPNTPGYSNETTSKEAAKSINPHPIISKIISELESWGETGCTCDEIEQKLGLAHQTASARLRELSMKQHIVDSGIKRKTRSGRNAIVWVLK